MVLRKTMSNDLVLSFCTKIMVLCRFSIAITMFLRKTNSCLNHHHVAHHHPPPPPAAPPPPPAPHFQHKHNGSRRFSDRKPMKRALPNTFSITKPRVACTLGWSSVHARLVAGHDFPSQTQRFASLFLTKTSGPSPAEHNFQGKTKGWVHGRLVERVPPPIQLPPPLQHPPPIRRAIARMRRKARRGKVVT